MKSLFILNDPPYGTERTYNGMRIATNQYKKDEAADVTVFLMADAVLTAKAGQNTPNGYYNLERMLKVLLKKGGRVLLCGSCMDARGLKEEELLEGCERSTLDALTEASMETEKVFVF